MLLGGNIELEGFEALEPAVLVIVKKMVGSEVRKISEEGVNLDKLKLCLESSNGLSYEISAKAIVQGSDFIVDAKEDNLFFGIDIIFKKLLPSIKP